MTGVASPERPRRVDVAASYDLGVDAYAALWSPVILAPARAVVAALGIPNARCVVDIGTGTGALVPSLRAVAPHATVIGLDAAPEMLRAARRAARLPAVLGDAASLPFRDGAVDAALLAYVLFHLRDPAAAVAEVARVLRRGGKAGTVTWMRDDAPAAFAVWDATLSEAGAPPLPPRGVHTGLDSSEDLAALLSGAGLEATRVWDEELRHRWDPDDYWRLATGSGVNKLRLRQLEPTARRESLARARRRLSTLPDDAFVWTGQVLCAVATKA